MPTFLVEKPEDYDKYFAEQLPKCGVEYFDYYLLHTLDRALHARTKAYGGFSFHDTVDVYDRKYWCLT